MDTYNEYFLKNKRELLNCNLNKVNFNTNDIDVDKELNIYYKSTLTENNYPNQHSDLASWKSNNGYVYPNIDPRHRYIVDTIKKNNYKKVIDFGAGCGMVSKFVYHENPNIEELVCIENGSHHYSQMLENFKTKTNVILPDIVVNATTTKTSLHNLKQFPDNYFDVGFTCTVLMHIPYIIAIPIICEISRICKNVITVENTNEMINCVVNGNTRTREEYCCIDYLKLYEKLNFNILDYQKFKDPHANCYYNLMHISKNIV